MSKFADLALPLIKLGLRVIPHGLYEPSRRPLGESWHERASTSASQVKSWAQEYSGHLGVGVGIVVGDDTHWALDIDEPSALKCPLPKTCIVRSGGGGLHVYFKHDAYSRRMLKPLGSKYVAGRKRPKAVELFVRNHALIAPGNEHHRTGKLYEWARKVKPIAAPKKFIDALVNLPWVQPVLSTTMPDREPGYWSLLALADFLITNNIDFAQRGDHFWVTCPGNLAGWTDGTSHSNPDGNLSSKSIVFIRNGWPAFNCKSQCCDGSNAPKKTWGDFCRFFDPTRRFSIDRHLVERQRQVAEEFRHGR